MDKELYKKYYKRLAAEGILKAIICAALIGFSIGLVIGLLAWLFIFDGLWALASMAVVTAIAVPLFYFFAFRPDERAVARRLDSLGLEERVITMLELEGENFFLAERQRNDAQIALKNLGNKKISFVFNRKLFISVVAVGMAAVFFTVASALSFRGLFPGPERIVANFTKITVRYLASEGGEIVGQTEQTVVSGENTEIVVPIAHEGYFFEGWSDGVSDAERSDKAGKIDMEVTAIFRSLNDDAGKNAQPEEDGPPSLTEGSGNTGPGGGDPEGPPGQGGTAAGQYEEVNQVIDKQTYYRDLYEEALRKAQEYLKNNQDVPEELRKILELYYDAIK